jgi:hypothetical protein
MARRKKFEDIPAAIAARNLGPEIELLRSFDVPASRIAFLLGDTHDNIRQISKRSQFRTPDTITLPALPTREQIEELALYGRKHKRIVEQEQQVEVTFDLYASQYQFAEGAEALKSFLPALSAPSHPRKLRLKAGIHHHVAWFSIHQGKCRSALEHGQYAMWLSHQAYKASWDRLDLDRYADTALIVSMAAHLSAEGSEKGETHSLTILWLGKEAAEAAGNPRGSEHYRQRGSALWNLGYEEEARKSFFTAMQKAQEKDEARDENHVKMIGGRFLNLLGKSPDWEGAQELLQEVRHTFGPNSLEYAININYTAAAGLLTIDPHISKDAADLLINNSHIIEPFGRQDTVRKLLSITQELDLNPFQRKRWIKQALRSNGLRKF